MGFSERMEHMRQMFSQLLGEDTVCPECQEEMTQAELDNWGGVCYDCYEASESEEESLHHPDDWTYC